MMVLCIICCSLSFIVTASAETVTGTVTMNNEILTYEGVVYVVEEDEKGIELLAFMGETVAATGVVNDVHGKKIIKLSDFIVIPETGETSGGDLENTSDETGQ